jgi:hypothetical protein
MNQTLEAEIARNYDFFQRSLADLLPEYRGQFALIRHAKIVAFFQGPGTAYREGLSQFSDEVFSVQEVDDRPVEMGLTSLALD